MPINNSNKTANIDSEHEGLSKLLDLISSSNKTQLPVIDNERSKGTKPLPWPNSKSASRHSAQSAELVQLEKFSAKYQNERSFSEHVHKDSFQKIFSSLIRQRLCCSDWLSRAPPENIHRILTCLRILLRDKSYQKKVFELDGAKILCEYFKKATDSYLTYGDGPFVVDILKEMSNIFQKLSTVSGHTEWLAACGVIDSLVLLLSALDVIILHCSLHALISFSQSSKPRQLIGELNTIELLLRIIQEYDTLSKKHAANLLRSLCADSQCREKIKLYDGIPILLSQLHSDNANLLWHVVWCLVQLCEDLDVSNDIRELGGIPLLLALLHQSQFVSERTEASDIQGLPLHGTECIEEMSLKYHPTKRSKMKGDEFKELQYSLKSACSACLTELVLNDTNAQQIVQANGIYILGLHILPQPCKDKLKKSVEKLQRNAFRTLRFLFSMERNRRQFKQLFPPDIFELFIDVGHYNKDLRAYKPLVSKINHLSSKSIEEIKDNILLTNQHKAPSHYIGDFAIFEVIGTGGFGSVYKVRKKTAGQSFLALKEIQIQGPAFGKNTKEKERSVGEMMNELSIVKEQLKHPNVVRYYKTFIENDKLYVVMELIEGATLVEHFNSLKEKKEKFAENRIWNILMQMILALRYLHKEKRIVHRDLSPNNVMLGENDKVTITDFGLAKIKGIDHSKMTSVVGTMLYWCPEIVQSQPYGEKADIWALGCILYQMCTLKPPFYNTNILVLAKKIVEGDFEKITDEDYSERLTQTITSCMTLSPDDRPDVLQLSRQLIDILLVHMDNIRINHIGLEKKLDRERRRTQKHFCEANKNMQNYHRLFLVSQEKYEKIQNLSGSGGASRLKEAAALADQIFDDIGSSGIQRILPMLTEDSKGWTSDDDSCPSSGNNSRESSAGSVRTRLRAHEQHANHLHPSQNPLLKDARISPYISLSELTLDVNDSAMSRDSGFVSGDPSPNAACQVDESSALDGLVEGKNVPAHKYSRSLSTTAVDSAPGVSKRHGKRPGSAGTATLTISPQRVRQISDPILQMLHQLHKIIYISQLPPTLCPNHQRRFIEKYKRALFSQQSTSVNLKSDLKKLLVGSHEIIDLNFGPAESVKHGSHVVQDSLTFSAENPKTLDYDPDYKNVGITYEQMQSMIESVLVESGYYSMDKSNRKPSPPLSQSRNVVHTRLDSLSP